MLSPILRVLRTRPSYIHGTVALPVMGFYVGLLFFIGASAATVTALGNFRGRLRWLVGFGGGFFGLSTWFTVLLNHREAYERVVAFLCRYLSKSWSTFVCDAFICTIGAVLFVATLAAVNRGTRYLIRTARARLRGSRQENPDQNGPEQEEE